jgi:hypothetical protein
MTVPWAPDSGDGLDKNVCPTCQHPLSSHDAISSRWCGATAVKGGHRDCICSLATPKARVLTHY